MSAEKPVRTSAEIADTKKPVRTSAEILDTIADLDKMLITAQWIEEEFLLARRGQQEEQKTKKTKNIFFCWRSASEKKEAKKKSESQAELAKKKSEQAAELSKLSEKLSELTSKRLSKALSTKLHKSLLDHAIYSHKQLEDVAMQAGGVAQLYEILQCKGAVEAITKYYDNLKAVKESLAPTWKSIELALTGELESMDAYLMNFGLAAALITGASMSNFSSITKDDWLAYLPLALREKTCQDKAKEHCGLEALSPDHLGWEPLYCQAAVDLLKETPHLKLAEADPNGLDLSCCIEALECAKITKWNLELAYTIGCGGASAAMLLVVLFSAWIFIALHATSANRGRSEEANLLRDQFKDEFVIVHVLFLFGVIFGFVGIIAVISLKVGTLVLSWTAWGITLFAAILSLFLFFKCPWEVYWLNQKIDEERGFDRHELADKYEIALKKYPTKLEEAIKAAEAAIKAAEAAEADAKKAEVSA